MRSTNHLPYRYSAGAAMLLLLLSYTLPVLAQDSVRRAHLKDTVFPRVDSLKAAVVTATLRPRLKGDTVEFNTGSLRLRANANVEQLLGRLPGLQIDIDGNITYNGEKIQHLLVDGEDIFAGSPTLVTRNFDASKIARVQILDRKSDQAQFTGVDDGTRTKTLNLVLKESAKDGYFGKVEAGGNVKGYYNSNAALAGFKEREQFTALGLTANTGALGFSSGAGNGSASIGLQNSLSDPLGGSAGTGIPRVAGAAVHYANTWNGTVDHVVGNYQFGHLFTEPVTMTQSLEMLPGSTYLQVQQNRSVNRQDQHWGYGTYDWVPGKAGTFRLAVRASTANGENRFFSHGTSSFNDTLVNSSDRSVTDTINQRYLGADASWKIAIGRPDRNLSIYTSFIRQTSSTEGYLYSANQFYTSGGVVVSQDTIDQRKKINNDPSTLSTGIYYTEPLWKSTLLAISYNVSAITNTAFQGTYNRGDGKYDQLVDSLSSNIQTHTVTQGGVLNLQGKAGRVTYTIGTNMLAYSYRQRDYFSDSVLRQHYLNWAPRVLVSFNIDPVTNIKFNYASSTQQPSVNQLQPVKTNNDPLHLTIGNPDLQPAVTQTFRVDFHRVKAWISNLDLFYANFSNTISTRTITDSLVRQISQPVNVDGGHSAGLGYGITRKILGVDLGIYGSGSYSRAVNFVNADLNQSNTYLASGGLSLNRNVPDRYLLQLYTQFQYFAQNSSINSAAPVNYWSQSSYGMLSVYLLRNFEMGTLANYNWQQKASSFAKGTSVLLWNTYVSRNFLGNMLVIKAQWNNILNQNAGISRSNMNNTVTETSTNILGRYWMVSAIYHFDKKFKRK